MSFDTSLCQVSRGMKWTVEILMLKSARFHQLLHRPKRCRLIFVSWLTRSCWEKGKNARAKSYGSYGVITFQRAPSQASCHLEPSAQHCSTLSVASVHETQTCALRFLCFSTMWPARCTIRPNRALDCAVLGHLTVQITEFRNQIVAI